MEKLEIDDLVFFERNDDGDLEIQCFDHYENTITFNYLNQQEIKLLIKFLQKQIV